MSRESLLLNNSQIITDFQSKKLSGLVRRRLEREPVARILGVRSFWKSEFKVSRETLDPRADSETLVEAVLKNADKKSSPTILDLGTGTGCLLLSLLQEFPQATGMGIDISAGAVQTAQENAENLGLSGRAEFVHTDWGKMEIRLPFDIVVSNPPYISEAEIPHLAPEVSEYDPYRALVGGKDGLECYRIITNMLRSILKRSGKVYFEIGATQAKDVQEILAERGYRVLQTIQDLAGHDRCIVAQLAQDV
jgi:release factor glutamine methyltransferase